MAQNVVDSLVVTLGLDASNFKKGQKDATKAWADTKTSIKADSAAMSSAIASVAKEFIGLFFAVRGIEDVIHGFSELNTTLSALGYTARQLGESSADLRLYQQIAGGFGGTAQGVNNMVSGLEQGMFQLRYMGQMSGQMLAWMRFGGGMPATNAQGGIDVLKMVSQLREHLKGMGAVDKNQILTALGVDEGTRNAILATNAQYQKWLALQQQSPVITAKGVWAAQSLQRAWRNLGYELAATASQILTTISPVMKGLFAEMGDWVGRHSTDFQKWLDQFAAWANGRGPAQIATAFDTIANAVLGLAKVLSFMGGVFAEYPKFGNWLGGKIFEGTHGIGGVRAATNPLNLKAVGNQPRDSKGFAFFPTQKAGIDAAEVELTRYRNRGWNTISSIISHWAPASDHNNVPAYIADVSKYVGKGPNVPLSASDYPLLMAAMARHESGAYAPNLATVTASMIPMGRAHHTSTTHIGSVTINTRATDAAGIAGDFHKEVQRKFNVFQADNGVY